MPIVIPKINSTVPKKVNKRKEKELRKLQKV